jgi:transposase-like protein
MRKEASDERRRFWRGLIERQPTSGLNITQFCAQAGVSQNSFYVWKRRLRATAPKSGRKRRHLGQQRALATASALVPVRLIPDLDLSRPAAQPIEIAWPSGLVLRIPYDAQTLRDVFHLLASTLTAESTAQGESATC